MRQQKEKKSLNAENYNHCFDDSTEIRLHRESFPFTLRHGSNEWDMCSGKQKLRFSCAQRAKAFPGVDDSVQ
jgi:hypothetical protein